MKPQGVGGLAGGGGLGRGHPPGDHGEEEWDEELWEGRSGGE